MYTDATIWLAIILAGIAGCLATALFANWLKGIPIAAIAGNWKKHLWSIIFAIPVPLILGAFGASGVFIAFLWLMLVPTIASKIYFGPKDVPAMVLNAFHCGYGTAVLVVYVWISRTFLMIA
jgi:hypothetical protein